MNVGNFTLMPKEIRHFAMNKGETIVQIHGAGPFKVNWVNPSEVPPPDTPAANQNLTHRCRRPKEGSAYLNWEFQGRAFRGACGAMLDFLCNRATRGCLAWNFGPL